MQIYPTDKKELHIIKIEDSGENNRKKKEKMPVF